MFFLIIFYLFTVVVMSAISIGAILIGLLPAWMGVARLGLMCGLFGALGGALYCVRAVYVNRSARNEWKPEWHCWYFFEAFGKRNLWWSQLAFSEGGAARPGCRNEGGCLAFRILRIRLHRGVQRR